MSITKAEWKKHEAYMKETLSCDQSQDQHERKKINRIE